MKRWRTFFLFSGILSTWISMLILPMSAKAQQQMMKAPVQAPLSTKQASIESITPKSIHLTAGGQEVVVTITGADVNKITAVQVIQRGKLAPNFEARFGRSSATSMPVYLKAKAEARLGTYQLRIIAGAQSIDIPINVVTIEVKADTHPTTAVKKEVVAVKKEAAAVALGSLQTGPMPDLSFTPCNIRYVENGCSANPGGKFTIDTAVKNIGSVAITFQENWPIVSFVYGSSAADLAGSHWVISGPPGGRLLLPGEEINVSMWECIVAQPPGTTRQLYYKADPLNKIPEANESNNELTCQYTIPQYSAIVTDVAVLTVQPTPSSGPSASTLFKFAVTVKNVGSTTVPTTRVTCSPEAGTKVISALASGVTQTVTLEMTYHMPAGQKTVTCTASAADDTNSANNQATATFTVTN